MRKLQKTIVDIQIFSPQMIRAYNYYGVYMMVNDWLLYVTVGHYMIQLRADTE